MRRAFYFLSAVPATLLLTLIAVPQFGYFVIATTALGVLCPVIAIIGCILLFNSTEKKGLAVATIAAALPGIILWMTIRAL